MSIYTELSRIQRTLKAPKNQRNNFGGYNYRSCEDIMEAVKPLLNDCVLTVTDDVVQIADRFYVKATARIALSSEDYIENSAFAREPLDKKGMDSAQITGATSSYARKYAMNGLLAIDDTKDADATNTHGAEDKKATKNVRSDFEKEATAQKKALNSAVKANNPEQLKATPTPLSEQADKLLEWLSSMTAEQFQSKANSAKDKAHDVRDALLSSGLPELAAKGVLIADKLKEFEPELDDDIIF